MAQPEPTETQAIQQIEAAGARERISVLDPDFLLVLTFAVIMDGLDIILQALKLIPAGIPASMLHVVELIDTPLDLFTFLIIGGWIFWRTGRIANAKKKSMEAIKKRIAQRGIALEKQLARLPKMIQKPLRRMLLRGGVALLAESIPIPLIGSALELMPFWVITVILTLREK